MTYFLPLPDIDERERALEVVMDSSSAVDEVVWLDSESNHQKLFFAMCWPTLRAMKCDIPSYGDTCPRVSFTTSLKTTTTGMFMPYQDSPPGIAQGHCDLGYRDTVSRRQEGEGTLNND